MSNHWYNIEGCLTFYRDLKGVEQWLIRGHKELPTSDFSGLLDTVMRWLVDNPAYGDIAADVVQLLSGYDPKYTAQWHEAEEARRREAELRAREIQEAQERRKKETELLAQQQREAEARQRRERKLAEKKQALMDRCHEWFQTDFLTADRRFRDDADRKLLTAREYSELKTAFVQGWVHTELHLSLDIEQAQAVAGGPRDMLVVARAGAGKTRTLVTRAVFLQKHCGVPPAALLLLAFNRDAAREMQQRLHEALGGDLPHIMTFHALAYALVHPDEELVYDKPSAGSLGHSRAIQQAIDEHLQADRYRAMIRDLMLLHFKDDWERIVAGGFNLPIEELIEYRLALPRETLRGEYVKSFGERLIANTLFQNDVEYKYERNYRWNGVNYRPDFTILLPGRRGVVIEYFGLEGERDYDEMSADKRAFWASRQGWTLIEFYPQDIASQGVDGFTECIVKRLADAGVTTRSLSDDEIWQRIRRRAIDSFTGAVRSLVSRCRKLNLTGEQLAGLIDGHTPITEAERLFLAVGASVYVAYLERLRSSQQEDFDGLMWRAITLVDSGHSQFARDRGRERGDLRRIRHVLVDEFQDFSQMFYRMVQGIRTLSPHADFFCVGDDWQAINGFAGSDLRFFREFSELFREPTTFTVSTNYRSPAGVVELGNALMVGRGSPAKPHREDAGCVRLADLGSFMPSPAERARHEGDDATPFLLRLIRRLLDCGDSIVLLSRRNGVPWYVKYHADLPAAVDGLERFAEHIRMFLPEDERGRLTASTAHRYKGREREAVIILDADEGCYPLIHPNWEFLRVFGDTLEAIESEERRLFYVALTRSQKTLVVLVESERRESPYLREIKTREDIQAIEWEQLRPVPSLDGDRLEVHVSNAYEVHNELAAQGYRWEEGQKYWYRLVMAEGFDLRNLKRQAWARQGVCIDGLLFS